MKVEEYSKEGVYQKRSVNENHSETSTIKLGFANPKKGFS